MSLSRTIIIKVKEKFVGIFDKFNKKKTNDFKVIAFKSVNGIEFGINRDEVLDILGKPKKSFRKTQVSKVETDVYENFHISYDNNYNFEYIEIFGNNNIYYNDDKLPKNYSEV